VDDAAMAKLLLGAGAQATAPNRYGLTPMAIAAGNGSASMIAILLDAGADANAPDPAGDTPFMSVIACRTSRCVTLLLDRGAKVDATDATYQQTALMVAVRENHPDIVKLLIARGASVNARTRCGPTPAWVLPNSQPGFGHGIGIVRGGSPDRGRRGPIPGGMTPLMYAARDGRMDTVRMLLEAGAEINARDANDITPLITAITNNHPDVARLLIDRGADIKATDWYGRTPLWARSRRATWISTTARSRTASIARRFSS
jgi:ankyrin repeat protein